MSIRACAYILRYIVLGTDTTTIRFLLATASLWAGIAFIVQPQILEQPNYAVMAYFGGPYRWAALFFLHFFGTMWRLVDFKSRVTWAIIFNSIGVSLWWCMTLSIIAGVQNLTPAMGVLITLCFASLWALYRTGVKREITSP